ncbi:hypothetical protein [Photorhabdus temperata]|nr:hypothetical protein [Photorhabdus temperata]
MTSGAFAALRADRSVVAWGTPSLPKINSNDVPATNSVWFRE